MLLTKKTRTTMTVTKKEGDESIKYHLLTNLLFLFPWNTIHRNFFSISVYFVFSDDIDVHHVIVVTLVVLSEDGARIYEGLFDFDCCFFFCSSKKLWNDFWPTRSSSSAKNSLLVIRNKLTIFTIKNIYVYHRRLQGALRVLHHHYWILRRWLDCATIFQMSHLIHFGLVHRCQNRVGIFSFGGLYPLYGLRLEVLASDHVLGSIL